MPTLASINCKPRTFRKALNHLLMSRAPSFQPLPALPPVRAEVNYVWTWYLSDAIGAVSCAFSSTSRRIPIDDWTLAPLPLSFHHVLSDDAPHRRRNSTQLLDLSRPPISCQDNELVSYLWCNRFRHRRHHRRQFPCSPIKMTVCDR